MKTLFLYTFLVMLFVGKVVYQKQLQSNHKYLSKKNALFSQKLSNILQVQSQNFELHFAQALSFLKEKQADKALEHLDMALVLLKKEQQKPIHLQPIVADNSITLDAFLHYYEYYIYLYKFNILQKQENHCELLEEMHNNYHLLNKQASIYVLKAKSEWILGENTLACQSFEKAKTFSFSKKEMQDHIRLLAAANYRFGNEGTIKIASKEYDYFKIRWQAFVEIEKNIRIKKMPNKCLNT